jgi:hypothetical protein
MSRKSAKTHSPTDTVQTTLRMKAEEHARLTAAAKAHRSPLGAEIMWRVMRTFTIDNAVAVQDVVRELLQPLEPYLLDAYARGLYSDCLFASRQLIDVINPLLAAGEIKGRAGQKARAAIESFHLARHNIELRFGEEAIEAGNAESPKFQDAAHARLEAAGEEEAWNDEAVRIRRGGFPKQGAAEWPNDTFTRGRIADGSIKISSAQTNLKEPPK